MADTSKDKGVSLILPPDAQPAVEQINRLIAQGLASEALSRLPVLMGYRDHNPLIIDLAAGGFLVDIGKELKDANLVRQGVDLMDRADVTGLPEDMRSSHLYNLGNGYGGLFDLKDKPTGVERVLDPDFKEAKRCYREALRLPSQGEVRARQCTNYAILLRQIGRRVEEIELYDQALQSVPGHAMALFHKARGLRWYAQLVEPPYSRSAVSEARELYRRSLASGLEATVRAKVERELADLDRAFGPSIYRPHGPTDHSVSSDVERRYVEYCVQNRLYLHPCPHEGHQAYRDMLWVRFPTGKKREYFELGSEKLALLKREFIGARFLMSVYALRLPDIAFVDRGTFVVSTGAEEDIYLQFLRFSFRSAYAALDKIADFLNTYCGLNISPEKSVYFSKDLFMKAGEFRGELALFDCLELAAMLDICEDFSRGELRPLRNLRNKLEHRCLVIIPTDRETCSPEQQQHNGLVVSTRADQSVTESSFYQDTLMLLKAVRALIFYLFYFVRKTVEKPES